MDLPPEVDDFIKELINHTLGLLVSTCTLELKIRCSEKSRRRLRDQYSLLLAKLKEKDQGLERSRAEASMNAQAIRKFVEENERLAAKCNKLEKESELYETDREALMDFGNEADQRAKEAEFRVEDLDNELSELRQELQFFKNEKQLVDSSVEDKLRMENIKEHLRMHLLSVEEESNKRKSSSKMSSRLIQGKIDFSAQESVRQPLSLLHCNSLNSRLRKKQ